MKLEFSYCLVSSYGMVSVLYYGSEEIPYLIHRKHNQIAEGKVNEILRNYEQGKEDIESPKQLPLCNNTERG